MDKGQQNELYASNGFILYVQDYFLYVFSGLPWLPYNACFYGEARGDKLRRMGKLNLKEKAVASQSMMRCLTFHSAALAF